MKKTIAKLLAHEEYGVDDDGFLYKLQAGGVYRPLSPKTSRYGANRVYFEVKDKHLGVIHFYQESLKRDQHNAIGVIKK